MKQKRQSLKTAIDEANLFETIDSVIREDRLYSQIGLQRQDIVMRFGIGRHRLNDLLKTYANGQSFPQYINDIRMKEAYALCCSHQKIAISDIARIVGLSPANFRRQFKQVYGDNPTIFRKKNNK